MYKGYTPLHASGDERWPLGVVVASPWTAGDGNEGDHGPFETRKPSSK